MFKSALSVVLFCGFALCLSTPALADLMVRERVRIQGDYIHAGDIFAGSDDVADTILREAPEPGGRLVITRRDLAAFAQQIAKPLELPAYLQRVIVERDGLALSKEMIADHIFEAALNAGADSNSRIQIFGGTNSVMLPIGYGLSDIEITRFDYNDINGRISADLAIPTGANRYKSLAINARLEAVRMVPTLNTTITPGQLITADDIEWRKFAANRVGRSVVQSENDLVGLTVRRALKPGALIRSSDIERALMIKKGAIVTMIYKHGGIALTAAGRASENGGAGDIIRLTNNKSGQAVEARILSPDRVEVLTGATLIAARS